MQPPKRAAGGNSHRYPDLRLMVRSDRRRARRSRRRRTRRRFVCASGSLPTAALRRRQHRRFHTLRRPRAPRKTRYLGLGSSHVWPPGAETRYLHVPRRAWDGRRFQGWPGGPGSPKGQRPIVCGCGLCTGLRWHPDGAPAATQTACVAGRAAITPTGRAGAGWVTTSR